VLTAALALIDAGGVDGLSMRRLGRALQRDPMRLYRYAPSKNALLDGVGELVLSGLRIPVLDPADDGGGWEAALRVTAHSFRELALAHPNVVALLLTRPLVTPLGLRPLGTLRPMEELLELLIRAGFDPAGALHAYRLYMGVVYGHVLTELQERATVPDETDAVGRLGLHHVPPQQFPRLRFLAAEFADYDGARELDKGLDIVLSGLRGQLTASDHTGAGLGTASGGRSTS
jgi:AcrR family transcriptional regulator